MDDILNLSPNPIEIMVVDDAPENIRILTRTLKREGFHVTSAASGKTAMDLISIKPPDLLLLDVMMPGWSGLDVCEMLKKNPKTINLPVIFVSALDHIDVKARGFKAGGVDYISRPFHTEEVLLRVNRSLKTAFIQKELAAKAKTMENLIDDINIPTWEWNLKTNQGIKIDRWTKLLGYSNDELTILNLDAFNEFIHPDDFASVSAHFEKLFSKEAENFSIEIRLKHKDDRWVWVAFRSKVTSWGSDGLPQMINGSFFDISKRKYAELGLSHSEERYAQLREQSGSFVWEVDTNGMYTFVEYVSEMVIGYSPEELVMKKHFYDLSPESEQEEFKKNALQVFSKKTPFKNFENRLMTKDGTLIWVSTNGIPLLDERGNLLGYRGNDMDITARKKKEDEILYLSYHDQLTGLYNRRFAEEELIVLDTVDNLPISIIMGDVNGLKLVNDSFGHAMGDELLKKAASTLRVASGANDIIARWGGDEYVIILPKTDAAEAEKLTTFIREAATRENVNGIALSISFGSATKTRVQENVRDILKDAEDELYRHKLYDGSGMRSATVQLIMNTLYEKNNREMHHSKRVSAICEAIAVQMNFKKDDVSKMRIAGLMHDIGKIGINENILNKPGKLNSYEWNEMKKHSEIGYRILISVKEFHKIASYVLEHQEKWDGSGYPRGLKGEEISKQARIIAVADAYDAMLSVRTYGVQLSSIEAEQELKKSAGTHFDPEIVNVFIDKVMKTL